MKSLLIILVSFYFTSCIPLRIAPNIIDYKIMLANKFKRKLPKNYAFIFEDSKEADEFYNYMNIKYNLNYENVEDNVEFIINDNNYFLSFYETEIPTKHINFLPFIFEASIEMGLNGEDSYSGEVDISRVGHWYLVLTVMDSNFDDCLEPNYLYGIDVLSYLKALKLEYLSSSNYALD